MRVGYRGRSNSPEPQRKRTCPSRVVLAVIEDLQLVPENIMNISGKTASDFYVVKGIYAIYETYGVPLDSIIYRLSQNGYMPDWTDLYTSMLRAGTKSHRALSKIREACMDIYDQAFMNHVLQQLSEIDSLHY